MTLGEALAALAIASAAIALVPFRRVVRTMTIGGRRNVPAPSEQERIAARCRWAVRFWAARVPWKAVCFQRGLALHWMLRRRGVPSVLHYGVGQSGKRGLAAHVWLSLDGKVILGSDIDEDYACLAAYPMPAGGGPLAPLRAQRPAQE